MSIALRYALRSDVGLVRSNNQDSGFAGPNLLVVADGMGGHAGGDVASSIAVATLAPLNDDSFGSDDAVEELERALVVAREALVARTAEEPDLSGMGTTVTAILRTGTKLAMAHMGDRFEPEPQHAHTYEQLYRRVYCRMYKRLQPLYRDIRAITGYPSHD